MGTTLTGTTPQDTYDSLIKVTDNGPLSGTAKYLSDGLGNDSVLALSTTAVGVGITSPSERLEIQNAASGAAVKVSNSGGGYAKLAVSSNATSVAELSFTNSLSLSGGNVGIGTSSPSGKLHVAGGDIFIGASYGLKFSSTSYMTPENNVSGAEISTAGVFVLKTGVTPAERMRVNSAGDLLVGTTNTDAKVTVMQTSAARISTQLGNGNAQGLSYFSRVVRHYPVVSLGTKLIIPTVSQGNLNGTSIVRVMGHSARFNNNIPSGFTAEFAFGSLNNVSNLSTLSSTGNIASISATGSNIEINFTSDYTSATADGVFVTIEYMCNNITWSIDVANIAMN